MRHRGDVDDLGDDDPSVIDGPDSGLTAGSGTFNIDFNLAQARVVSSLGSVLGSHLGSVRGVLLGTPETALSGGGPTDDLSLVVGQGDNHVVEG